MSSNRFALLLLLCWPAGAQTSAPAVPAPAPAPPAYVGSETCQPCHEDIYNAFQKSPHKLVDTQKRRGWEGKACESCHGPGGAHAASAEKAAIVNPAHLPPAEADRDCLKCHLNQPTHIGRIQNSHAKNEVSCTACHSVHRNGPDGMVPRKMAAINELCASCHTAVWAEFQRPYKHRLPEAAMSCVDCHNPHGSILRASAQSYAVNEPGCFRCHGNLRGPFTFEHAPVRLEAAALAMSRTGPPTRACWPAPMSASYAWSATPISPPRRAPSRIPPRSAESLRRFTTCSARSFKTAPSAIEGPRLVREPGLAPMRLALALFVAIPLLGQTPAQTPAPTPAPAPADAASASPTPTTEQWITGTVDFGFRFTSVGGDNDVYRSVVNLGQGPRLLGLDLTIVDPKKRLFDRLEVRANTGAAILTTPCT